MKKLSSLLVLLMLLPSLAWADTISRATKSFGGTSFINGVIPQASDFNGDIDVIFGEFNGNISNTNISASAAIAATKINPDGFTVNVRTINAGPCKILEESDQSADAKRWYMCSLAGVLSIGTYSDAGVLQNNWLTIARANGGFTLGGSSGTNTVNGNTTFNQTVTFVGATSITPTGMVAMYMGTAAPSGWLFMTGGSHDCTGASAANASLCAQLVGLIADADYKGAAAAAITVDTGSDEIIHTAHGKSVGDRVHFSTTGGLPAPLSAAVVYCVKSVTTNRFTVTTTCGGAVLNITTDGTGTHSDHFNFVTPNIASRVPIGVGASAGLTTRTIGQTGGTELSPTVITDSHVLTTAQIPAHTHGISRSNSFGSGTLSGASPVGGAGAMGTASTGGGEGHTHNITPGSIVQPFLALNYIIKL